MTFWRHICRLWRLWLACVAAALVLAGCAQPGSPRVGVAASVTVNPPTAALPLLWRSASPPGSGRMLMDYAPAPSDGRVTYACGYTSLDAAPGVRVWRTDDRGASWSRTVTLPFAGQVSTCALTVDANDSRRLATVLDTAKLGANPGAAAFVALLSEDGGATWRTLPQAGPHDVMRLASFDGALYAAGSGLSASGAELRDVWVSRDGGRSWHALGAASLAPNPLIWINPQTGELLGTNDFDLIPTLWRGESGGARWTRLSVPTVVGVGEQQTLVVAPTGAGWHICATGQTAPGPQQTNALACSDDLGTTWTRRAALNPWHSSPKGYTFTAPSDVVAIADDGALVASYDDPASGQMRVAKLAPGASAWVSLGAPTSVAGTPADVSSEASAAVVYTTGPDGGMLWVAAGNPAHPFLTAMYP